MQILIFNETTSSLDQTQTCVICNTWMQIWNFGFSHFAYLSPTSRLQEIVFFFFHTVDKRLSTEAHRIVAVGCLHCNRNGLLWKTFKSKQMYKRFNLQDGSNDKK